MTVAGIINEARRRGLTLELRDGGIWAKPTTALSADLADAIRRHKPQLVAHLRARALAAEALARGCDLVHHVRDNAPCLLSETDDLSTPPAASLIDTCRSRGISLSIAQGNGDLIVGAPGDQHPPWPTLRMALEAHAPAVAALIAAGWHLRVGFPASAAA